MGTVAGDVPDLASENDIVTETSTEDNIIHKAQSQPTPKTKEPGKPKSWIRTRPRKLALRRLRRKQTKLKTRSSPGPGSYNGLYSSFGQKETFSTRKVAFGSSLPRWRFGDLLHRNGVCPVFCYVTHLPAPVVGYYNCTV